MTNTKTQPLQDLNLSDLRDEGEQQPVTIEAAFTETALKPIERGLPEQNTKEIFQAANTQVLRAYQDYFNMGAGRKLVLLQKVYEDMDKKYGAGTAPTTKYTTLLYWSKRYHWDVQARIDEADLYQERIAARKESARQLADRQSRASQLLQQIGALKLRDMINSDGLTAEGKSISVGEARRMLLEGAKLERDLFGGERALDSGFDDGEEITYE